MASHFEENPWGSLGQERVNILGVVGAELKVSAPLSAHLP